MHTGPATIDFGLLERLTDQLVCSRCLKTGVRRPVMQVVSRRHQPRTLCHDCVDAIGNENPDAPRVVDFFRAWLASSWS